MEGDRGSGFPFFFLFILLLSYFVSFIKARKKKDLARKKRQMDVDGLRNEHVARRRPTPDKLADRLPPSDPPPPSPEERESLTIFDGESRNRTGRDRDQSPIGRRVKQLASKTDLIVLSEILNPPYIE